MPPVRSLLLLALALALPAADSATPNLLPTPAQDQGLPYTRSGLTQARAALTGLVVVHARSRYAWVEGRRVRLDDAHWEDEPVERAGVVYVPAAFVPVVLTTSRRFDTPPAELAERWVSTVERPTTATPAAARTVSVEGKVFVALADLGVPVARSGDLLVIGRDRVPFGGVLFDNVVTLFDTPEKFADPAIATRAIPTLARQGAFTSHAKATPEQLAILDGPATVLPSVPRSAFEEAGIDRTRLGSAVPAPGIYPRLFFSPEDIPAVRARVTGSRLGQRSLAEMETLLAHSFLDPATDDGRIFAKLSSGDLAGLEWQDPPEGASLNATPHIFKGQKTTISWSHIAYVPAGLTSMAQYAMLTGNDDLGRRTATAIANYFRLREPLVDRWNATTDTEFGSGVANGGCGSTTTWRGMHQVVPNMDLASALDFGGYWMTADQKEVMRRVIAKATYGRRAYGQDGPARVRDVNWAMWDLPHNLAVLAIEGLPGCDPEVVARGRETLRAVCDWAIDDHGVVYESNGKTGPSHQYLFQTLVAWARRGEDLLGHPHLRRLTAGQMQMTSPSGRVTVNSGTVYNTYSRNGLSLQLVDELLGFYPQDKAAAYLLSQAAVQTAQGLPADKNWLLDGFDEAAHRADLTKSYRMRLPGFSYPAMARGVLFDTDWTTTTRAEVGLPLNFDDPTHGVFASRSDQTTDAAWMCMIVRPDHYLGAGHHHADAGQVHASALGIDWFTETRFSINQGIHHGLVQIDGRSQPDGYNGVATYLGGQIAANGAVASADLTYAYRWRWLTQPGAVWKPEEDAAGFEVDPTPQVLALFAGTARSKFRPWWHSTNQTNFTPTLRAPWNPVEYVFRSTALVRGAHPWMVVVDDLRKDDQAHRYDWVMPLGPGVWRAEVPGLAANQIVLAARPVVAKGEGKDRPAIVPVADEPLLLVTAAGLDQRPEAKANLGTVIAVGPADKKGVTLDYERLSIAQTSVGARFTVILTPLRAGQPLPVISGDQAAVTVAWPDQQDRLALPVGGDGRRQVQITRAGQPVVAFP